VVSKSKIRIESKSQQRDADEIRIKGCG